MAWALPILEAPALLPSNHHADPEPDLNHAQIRKPGIHGGK